MKLNYIDYEELPISVTFTRGDIELLSEFFDINHDVIDNYSRPHGMKAIVNCFQEINAKLQEI